MTVRTALRRGLESISTSFGMMTAYSRYESGLREIIEEYPQDDRPFMAFQEKQDAAVVPLMGGPNGFIVDVATGLASVGLAYFFETSTPAQTLGAMAIPQALRMYFTYQHIKELDKNMDENLAPKRKRLENYTHEISNPISL